VFSGPNKDVMHVIDKQKLEIVETLRPAPGKTSMHVEFDRYGKYALVSIWEMDGALVVYDAKTLQEIKTPADEARRRQIQRLEQDTPVGRHQPLTAVSLRLTVVKAPFGRPCRMTPPTP
jgi:hypothetical protein